MNTIVKYRQVRYKHLTKNSIYDKVLGLQSLFGSITPRSKIMVMPLLRLVSPFEDSKKERPFHGPYKAVITFATEKDGSQPTIKLIFFNNTSEDLFVAGLRLRMGRDAIKDTDYIEFNRSDEKLLAADGFEDFV